MLTEEQKALRRGRIGSSDIAALTGHHPWKRPIDVYRQAVEGWEPEYNESMELGDLLEPVVLELYRRRIAIGYPIEQPGTIVHAGHDFACSTPDAVLLWDQHGRRVIEAKTCAGGNFDQWGEHETDQVPPCYLIQATWHMEVYQSRHPNADDTCDIPVLLWGRDFRVYHVQLKASLAENLLEIAAKFHRDHIAKRVPPPVDGSESYSDFLKDFYPAPREPLRPADERAAALARRLAEAKAAHKKAEEAKRLAENMMRQLIGESEGIEGAGWKATWRSDKNGKRTLRFTEAGHGSGGENRAA